MIRSNMGDADAKVDLSGNLDAPPPEPAGGLKTGY